MLQKNKYALDYSPEYLKMGFIEYVANKQHPMCLLYHKTLSNEAMKPSRLRKHLSTDHPKDKPIEYFQEIYKKLQNQTTNEDGFIATYRISQLIAKSGKSYNTGEAVIIPSIKEFISTVMHQDIPEILLTLPLSDSTVKRQIDAVNVENKLISTLKNCSFSMQLDKSTIADNDALLMAHVRYLDENNIIREEMLFAINLIIDTKGLSIFSTVRTYLMRPICVNN
ncbi:hypothetical protein J437_LFUL005123 [Ladona fulva]|uniref:Uncharacterized protein n=1 Tax=Ladona fulva TaxID=123851 RepID=A0A8K0KGJ3_LADFU|nr:hypothetical protein J437_LFUL005123 [Ladona fulva]